MLYFLLYSVFALWVLLDALSRKMRSTAVLWMLGTAAIGPIVLPVYLGLRPLKNGEVREGGRAWNILKNFAILWTIVMAIVSLAVLISIAKGTSDLTSVAARAGAGIGMILGMGLLAAIWFFPAMGAALLGFFLKKNTVVENGPTGSLIGTNSSASPIGGWAGVMTAAFLGLIVIAAFSISGELHSKRYRTDEPQSVLATAESPTSGTEWILSDSVDKMDNTAIVTLTKLGTSGSALVIRCAKRQTEAYVNTDTVVDDSAIRMKFDQSTPARQVWTRSTDYKALFSPDAVTFSRKLANSKTFLFEFTPFQEGARTIVFDVSNLAPKLERISEACNWAAVDASRANARAANAALRARLAQYVHPCEDQEIGKWCWSDPEDTLDSSDQGFMTTREKALDDAVESAKAGFAFKHK